MLWEPSGPSWVVGLRFCETFVFTSDWVGRRRASDAPGHSEPPYIVTEGPSSFRRSSTPMGQPGTRRGRRGKGRGRGQRKTPYDWRKQRQEESRGATSFVTLILDPGPEGSGGTVRRGRTVFRSFLDSLFDWVTGRGMR